MRSSLEKKVSTNKVEFFYPFTVKARAVATQEGLVGAILVGTAGGAERKFLFNIPARPHTGIGPNDQKGIEDELGKKIGEALL
jgi:phage gpG-like protein